jgi:hypothetical protein
VKPAGVVTEGQTHNSDNSSGIHTEVGTLAVKKLCAPVTHASLRSAVPLLPLEGHRQAEVRNLEIWVETALQRDTPMVPARLLIP